MPLQTHLKYKHTCMLFLLLITIHLPAALTFAGQGINVTATTRPVVLEEFTATWCYYCYSMGSALDRMHAQYRPRDLVIIAFHVWTDPPFSFPFTDSRASYYSVGGIPSVWVNGLTLERFTGHGFDEGEAGIIQTYDSMKNRIETEQARIAGQAPAFSLSLRGDFTPEHPTLTVEVATQTSYPHNLALLAYVLEDRVPVNGSNGQTELNALVRATMGSQTLQFSSPGTKSFQLASSVAVPSYNPANLYPVVILQDASTREVLAAVSGLMALPNAAQPAWSLYQ